jgi:DNA repair exonuclease SbcCD ATPase subunit
MKSLYIKKISAQNIGPIERFEKDFYPSSLYVIYGKNETGKTFLAEFIIRTLFYDVDFWGYTREIDGKGKITISGIEEKDTEFAFQRSKKKNTLDKLLESRNYSLSPSLAKILLVKGGEVNLGKDVISKSILRNLLLERRIFEEIDSDSNISKTIKNAEIENDTLKIDKRGEGKDYQETKEKLEKFDKLIRELTEKLNLAEISTLELSIKELKEEKEKLERAKRYKAFKISQEIKEIDEELSKLPTTNELKEIESKIWEIKKKKKDYENIQKELQQFKEKRNELLGKKEEYEKQLKAKRYFAYVISKEIENLKKQLEKYSKDKINDIEAKIKEYNNAKNEYEEKKREANKLIEEIKDLPWIRSASENYAKLLEEKPKEPLNKLLIYISLTLLLLSILISLTNIKILSIPLIIIGTLTGGIYIYSLLKAFKDLPKKKELEDIKREFKDKFNQDLKTFADINAKKQELERTEVKLNSLDIEKIETKLKALLEEISGSLKEITGEDIAPENWRAKLKDLKEKIDDSGKPNTRK